MFKAVLFVLIASPAIAQTALSADEFEALVTGRTLDFGYLGEQPYGLERYLPNRQVVWSWGDNLCEQGNWYEQAGNICFEYDSDVVPQCWRYFKDGDRLIGTFMNADADPDAIYELTPVKRELVCDNFGT